MAGERRGMQLYTYFAGTGNRPNGKIAQGLGRSEGIFLMMFSDIFWHLERRGGFAGAGYAQRRVS